MARTWEVRNMDEADTAEAVAAASRAKRKTAEWLTEAIREKIARERVDAGEVIPPSSPQQQQPEPVADPWSPLALIQTVEAYERIMRLRGKPLSPRSRVLVHAERVLRAHLLPSPVGARQDAPPRQIDRPDALPRQIGEVSRQPPGTEKPDKD